MTESKEVNSFNSFCWKNLLFSYTSLDYFELLSQNKYKTFYFFIHIFRTLQSIVQPIVQWVMRVTKTNCNRKVIFFLYFPRFHKIRFSSKTYSLLWQSIHLFFDLTIHLWSRMERKLYWSIQLTRHLCLFWEKKFFFKKKATTVFSKQGKS